jgi:hypothetical protein
MLTSEQLLNLTAAIISVIDYNASKFSGAGEGMANPAGISFSMCSLRSLRLPQVFFNPFQYPLRVSQFMLPNPDDVPPCPPQGAIYDPVAGFVPLDFTSPVFSNHG